jgi:hypothetical protein
MPAKKKSKNSTTKKSFATENKINEKKIDNAEKIDKKDEKNDKLDQDKISHQKEEEILYNLRLHLNPYEIENKMNISADIITEVLRKYIFKEREGNSKISYHEIADNLGFQRLLVKNILNAEIKIKEIDNRVIKIQEDEKKLEQEINHLKKSLKSEVEYKELEEVLETNDILKTMKGELVKCFADMRNNYKYEAIPSLNKSEHLKEMKSIYRLISETNKTQIESLKSTMQASGKIKEPEAPVINNYNNFLQILNCKDDGELKKRANFVLQKEG